MDDLEDMMMMEAIRLSLASEEERRRKEEKEAKKEAKKKEKEAKKAEKAGRKNSLFSLGSNNSNAESASAPMERTQSMDSSIVAEDAPPSMGKGKAVNRPRTPPSENASGTPDPAYRDVAHIPGASVPRDSQESLTSSLPLHGAEPFKRSHLRQMSNVSSSASSFVDSGSTHAFPGSSTPPGSSSLEPMFNFRSLAAMIGDEDKANGDPAHVEELEGPGRARSFEELDDKPGSLPISPVSPSSASSGMPRDEGEHSDSNGDANGPVTQNGVVKDFPSPPPLRENLAPESTSTR